MLIGLFYFLLSLFLLVSDHMWSTKLAISQYTVLSYVQSSYYHSINLIVYTS